MAPLPLARAIGASRSAVYEWDAGKARPSALALVAIEAALVRLGFVAAATPEDARR